MPVRTLLSKLLTPVLMSGLSAAAEAFMRANPEAYFSTEEPVDPPSCDPDARQRFLRTYGEFLTEQYGERCEGACRCRASCKPCFHWRLYELVKLSLEE